MVGKYRKYMKIQNLFENAGKLFSLVRNTWMLLNCHKRLKKPKQTNKQNGWLFPASLFFIIIDSRWPWYRLYFHPIMTTSGMVRKRQNLYSYKLPVVPQLLIINPPLPPKWLNQPLDHLQNPLQNLIFPQSRLVSCSFQKCLQQMMHRKALRNHDMNM